MAAGAPSDGYFALLDRLDELASGPPWCEKAAEPDGSVLRRRVWHDDERLVARVEFADEAEDPGEREHRFARGPEGGQAGAVRRRDLTGVYGNRRSGSFGR